MMQVRMVLRKTADLGDRVKSPGAYDHHPPRFKSRSPSLSPSISLLLPMLNTRSKSPSEAQASSISGKPILIEPDQYNGASESRITTKTPIKTITRFASVDGVLTDNYGVRTASCYTPDPWINHQPLSKPSTLRHLHWPSLISFEADKDSYSSRWDEISGFPPDHLRRSAQRLVFFVCCSYGFKDVIRNVCDVRRCLVYESHQHISGQHLAARHEFNIGIVRLLSESGARSVRMRREHFYMKLALEVM